MKAALDATKASAAEAQRELARLRKEIEAADVEHAKWRRINAAERQQANEQVEQLQKQLRELEAQVAERRAEFDNLCRGIRALVDRLQTSGEVVFGVLISGRFGFP